MPPVMRFRGASYVECVAPFVLVIHPSPYLLPKSAMDSNPMAPGDADPDLADIGVQDVAAMRVAALGCSTTSRTHVGRFARWPNFRWTCAPVIDPSQPGRQLAPSEPTWLPRLRWAQSSAWACAAGDTRVTR